MDDLRLCGRYDRPKTVVPVGPVRFGESFVVIAGPCSVESEGQLLAAARMVKDAGAHALRGGAFKPRTSPYSFQGLGLAALKILDKARRETGLPIVTEVLDPRDVPWVSEFADMIQIGARNSQNFSLLKEAGKGYRPVLLKRGMFSTLKEWLNSAEYILSRRESQPRAVRARHPDVRGLHAEHPGPERRSGHSGALPSSGHRRSLPRHRPGEPHRSYVARGDRGRRRRPDDRNATPIPRRP